ncbi:hypothetical protein BU23DRAFT_603508 [Bimuria novae-zelandiae CBS 107.79]|uniref:Uncharacterized protein n=1 Tax=Bimuria novae-zelandiae CBS 107.79 TaxID=1447943 RepID=A0A6A5UNH1_9PLEO|nr:hypothetical protein BU23DRAFT_603508 [Bimuria novae-zelandiae CBS 107.79]
MLIKISVRDAPALPSAPSRFKRSAVQERSLPSELFKRADICAYVSDNNGVPVAIETKYIQFVICLVRVSINTTVNYYIPYPETTITQQETVSAVATTTVTSTSTTITVAATPTAWAACQTNNIGNSYTLNSIYNATTNRTLYFDRIFFERPSRNNTDINEITVLAVDPMDCCVKCQTAAEGCSEAFFAPAAKKCRLRLRNTISPVPVLGLPGIAPSPSLTRGALATGTAAPAVNPICPLGSATEHVGTIDGQYGFNPALARSFINGPCGSLSVDFQPFDNRSAVAAPVATPVGRMVRALRS